MAGERASVSSARMAQAGGKTLASANPGATQKITRNTSAPQPHAVASATSSAFSCGMRLASTARSGPVMTQLDASVVSSEAETQQASGR